MTLLSGIDFFDGEETHSRYQARREGGQAPNELIEEHAFNEMLGDVLELDILDLGCGDGKYGCALLQRGCRSYWGVDASTRMIALAEQHLAGTVARLTHARIDQFDFGRVTFDVVISRMTLHWLDDLGSAFEKIACSLRPTGRLVFSVEHPILTSSDAARVEGAGRTHWIVDDYFIQGARTVRWFGADVVKYHRSAEEYFWLLRASGFSVDDMREGSPTLEHVRDPAEHRRRQRVPLALLLSAHVKSRNLSP